ncbi:cytochrome P450 [Apiospora hydei]|uniref:Cytochrome P450 n=1 Tax=Apiospora hydei TaxID=1337664 RepID=A0ABR1WRS8_9PEZI
MGFQALLMVPLGIAALCLFTFLRTNLLYQIAIRDKRREKVPPILPHTIPWLGHVFGFLTPVPGLFFRKLLSWYPRDHGGASMKLAGRDVRLIFSTTAVQALMKAKTDVANSDIMIKDMICKGLGLSAQDYAKYVGHGRHLEHEVSSKHLLRPTGADVLLRSFSRFMKAGVMEESTRLAGAGDSKTGETVVLFPWLRSFMFKASATSFFGEHLFKEYPALMSDFWEFEPMFLDLLFGVPKFVNSVPHTLQKKVHRGMTAWVEANDRAMGDKVPSPDVPDVDWEPRWGSRLVRAREALFKSLGISAAGRASFELGMMFALNANAVPASGWLLIHILDPRTPDILPRIMEEIQEAVDVGDASGALDFDLSTLLNQPLLQSMFHEVLRLYVDVLITRGVYQDMKLPTEDGQRKLLLKKGTVAMAPSYVNHYDPNGYAGAPVDEFDGERFLVPADDSDEATGQPDDANKAAKVSRKPYAFSLGAAGAKMIPLWRRAHHVPRPCLRQARGLYRGGAGAPQLRACAARRGGLQDPAPPALVQRHGRHQPRGRRQGAGQAESRRSAAAKAESVLIVVARGLETK